MPGSINKCNLSFVIHIGNVSTNVLSDTAGFRRYHIAGSDPVKKSCLSMVNVTHDGNYRRSLLNFAVSCGHSCLFKCLSAEFCYLSDLESVLFSDESYGFRIESLVCCCHNSKAKTGCDNGIHRNVHKIRQFRRTGELSNIYYVFLACGNLSQLMTLLLLFLVSGFFALPVLCFTGIHLCQGFLHILHGLSGNNCLLFSPSPFSFLGCSGLGFLLLLLELIDNPAGILMAKGTHMAFCLYVQFFQNF